MTAFRRLAFLGMTACYALISAPASVAAVTVIGRGLARDCYLAVDGTQQLSLARALEVCTKALSDDKLSQRDYAGTLVNRGILQHRAGHYEAALDDYQQSLRIAPDLAEAHVNQGVTFFALRRFVEALASFNAGIEAPAAADILVLAYYNRALAHEHVGNIALAYDDFKHAALLGPGFNPALQQLKRFTVVKRQ